ncbi:MAG: polysaccharide biosynthesis tyrosine autokinase, partial [Phycisphaerales bacterium]
RSSDLRTNLLKDSKLDAMELNFSRPTMEQEEIARQMVENETRLSQVTSQLEDYQKRLLENRTDQVPDRLRDSLKRDPVMNQYDQKIASLKDNESALLKQGFGVNHDDVAAIRASIDASVRLRSEYEAELLQQIRASEVDAIQSAISQFTATKKALEEKNTGLDTRRQEIVQAKVRFDQIESDLQRLKDELGKFELAYTDSELAIYRQNDRSEAFGDRVRVISAAETPTAMSFPQLRYMAPLGGILVMGLVGGLIFLREVLDQRVRGPHEAAMVPRVKVLGIVPEASEDPSRPAAIETAFRDSPVGVVTESFRQLRAPLIQKMDYSGHKSLLVMSGMPGSGATTVASNLALGCAGAGERVLIIDANFRRPGMQRVYKLAEGNGLADVLAGTACLDDAVQGTSVEGLSVLCAGTAAARAVPERLAGEAMNRVLLEASAKYDRIFIDVPPAIVAGDGMSVANRCDAAIVVVRAYGEKRGLLARVRNQLGDTRAEFLGVVVNAVRASAGGYFKRNIKATHQYQNGRTKK